MSVLWGMFCYDTPEEQIGTSGGCSERVGETKTYRDGQRMDMLHGCFGFLPLKGWLLTTDLTTLNHQGLAIFFLRSSPICWNGGFIHFLKPACWFRPVYVIYRWCHVVHCQPLHLIDLLSVGSLFWRVCLFQTALQGNRKIKKKTLNPHNSSELNAKLLPWTKWLFKGQNSTQLVCYD